MNDTVGAVAAVTPNESLAIAQSVRAGSVLPQSQADFGQWFETELQSVNTRLVASEHGLQGLAAGDAVNLHEVMMRAEEAKLSLQLMVQVRNRALDAYQELMRIQG